MLLWKHYIHASAKVLELQGNRRSVNTFKIDRKKTIIGRGHVWEVSSLTSTSLAFNEFAHFPEHRLSPQSKFANP